MEPLKLPDKQDQAKPFKTAKTNDTTQFEKQALPRVHRKDLEFKTDVKLEREQLAV